MEWALTDPIAVFRLVLLLATAYGWAKCVTAFKVVGRLKQYQAAGGLLLAGTLPSARRIARSYFASSIFMTLSLIIL